MLRLMTPDERKSVLQRATEALSERQRKRATQRDIAKAAGIKQPSVNEWRNAGPRIEIARQFCQVAGCCVEWLYTGRGPKRPPPTDALGQRLMSLWAELPDDDSRGIVLGFIAGLLHTHPTDRARGHGSASTNEDTAKGLRVLRVLERP
jgi:DNA-binding XRE family transcriptional regulator